MFNRLLNRFGSKFYNAPKEYFASYEATVKNTSRARQNSHLIIPLVASTDYQTLIEEPRLLPEGTIAIEPDYQNKYVIHQLTLNPNESTTFKQIFKIKVLPRRTKSINFKLKHYESLDDSLKKLFLRPNEYLASREPEFIELAQKIAGNTTDLQKIIEAINQYVIGHLTYGNPIPGLYRAQDVIRSFDGLRTTGVPVDCGGFDTVFVTLCQALGIPARVVSGFWAGYHMNDMHAWAEVLLPDGSWLAADPSTEHLTKHKRTRKSGALGCVGSDRIAMSVGCDLELEADGKRFNTDILQNPIIFPENDKLEVTRIFSTQPL